MINGCDDDRTDNKVLISYLFVYTLTDPIDQLRRQHKDKRITPKQNKS